MNLRCTSHPSPKLKGEVAGSRLNSTITFTAADLIVRASGMILESPMLRLAARDSSPTLPVLSKEGGPVNTGLYHIRATHPDAADPVDAVFEIRKTVAQILPIQTKRSISDEDRRVALESNPPGLELSISYQGSDKPPGVPGLHPFRATVVDRNHNGELDGAFLLTAARYGQWQTQYPETSERGLGDADGDGTPDLVECAVGNDPGTPDPAIGFHIDESGSCWRIRRRRWMDEITLKTEVSEDLVFWEEIFPQVTVEDGEWENLFLPHQESSWFIRLRAEPSSNP